MNTNLTPTQTISIGIAIALTTLIFLTILLTIAYIEEIRNLLTRTEILLPRIPRTNFQTAPFPQHYVDPYTTEPQRRMGQLSMASGQLTTHACTHRRTTTIRVSSSDEYLSSQEDIT